MLTARNTTWSNLNLQIVGLVGLIVYLFCCLRSRFNRLFALIMLFVANQKNFLVLILEKILAN